jgi:hypothetical protein
MLLDPLVRVELFPSSLDLRDGILRLRGKTVVKSTKGRLEGMIHPCDLRAVRGNAVFEYITGVGRAHGEISGVNFSRICSIPFRIEFCGRRCRRGRLALDRGAGRGSIDFTARWRSHLDQTLRAGTRAHAFFASTCSGFADFEASGCPFVREEIRSRGSSAHSSPAAMVRRPDDLSLTARFVTTAPTPGPVQPLNVQMPHWAEHVPLHVDSRRRPISLAPSLVDVRSLDATGRAPGSGALSQRKGHP